MIQIKVKRLHPVARMPTRAYDDDAGWDLYAAEYASGDSHIIVPTGIAVEIPPGHYGQILGRSGHAMRRGLGVIGGVIDSGFRGEIRVVLANSTTDRQWFEPGDRVAQLVILPLPAVEFVDVTELSKSERGATGFGSTGG